MKYFPRGLVCILVLVAIFGYMSSVMGMANMINTLMNTAHSLLLNTVFYLMGMCVITGALSRILMEFGTVDLLQKLLRPFMTRLFNLPGVASIGSVMTFLSDSPAIISLARQPEFARYFKKYQHVSVVNASFGMGLLVMVFMIGQGYYLAPAIGLVGALCGRMFGTRLIQYFVCKDYPEYRTEDAVALPAPAAGEEAAASAVGEKRRHESLFIRILNSLLDGGKDGVNIGLAIIPGVVIISTFVMMLTFGGSAEGVDADGETIVVFTGGAYQGTRLLPWLAGQVDFLFRWLFGFDHAEIIAFPITALGTVGAALGLIPEFIAQHIMDGNAIAVCAAMGMSWSGYLSADASNLDQLGYRHLVPRSYVCTFLGGIVAGIVAHWIYFGVTAMMALFAPTPVLSVSAEAWNDSTTESIPVQVTAYEDGTWTIADWYGIEGCNLSFRVNASDSTIAITNAYACQNDEYYFVRINEKAPAGHSAYAALYPVLGYSEFDGNAESGYMYVFAFIYDTHRNLLNRCYYEVTWGGHERQTSEAAREIEDEIEAEKQAAEAEVGS